MKNQNSSGILNKRALTLAELLIAAVLMSVIMVGAISVDYAIRSTKSSTSKYNIASADATAALLQLSRDASLTVGNGMCDTSACTYTAQADGTGTCTCSATSETKGFGLVYSPRHSICFRHDGGDINSYADDTWTCYFQNVVATSGIYYALTRCDLNAPAASCSGLSETELKMTDTNFFTVNLDPSSGQLSSLTFTLPTRPDPVQNADPLKNPNYTATTTISPAGLSR